MPDDQLLDRASQQGRVLFSRDEDLLAEAAGRLRRGIPFATVVFARQSEVSIGRCVTDLEIVATAINNEFSG